MSENRAGLCMLFEDNCFSTFPPQYLVPAGTKYYYYTNTYTNTNTNIYTNTNTITVRLYLVCALHTTFTCLRSHSVPGSGIKRQSTLLIDGKFRTI